MSPVWILAVSLFWPTVPLTGGAQSDSGSLSTVIQLCLSDLLPRSSDVFLWANTRELGVKLSNCSAPSPTSPPLSQRGNRQAKMTRSSVVFGTSVMGATVPSEEDRLAYLNPSPSKKAPITEAITPSRDGERQHKQCAGTPRSSPHIQLQSRWSHVVSRWVLIAICGYTGVAARRSLIDRISASACWRRCLCDEIRCKKKRPPTTNKQNIL